MRITSDDESESDGSHPSEFRDSGSESDPPSKKSKKRGRRSESPMEWEGPRRQSRRLRGRENGQGKGGDPVEVPVHRSMTLRDLKLEVSFHLLGKDEERAH